MQEHAIAREDLHAADVVQPGRLHGKELEYGAVHGREGAEDDAADAGLHGHCVGHQVEPHEPLWSGSKAVVQH